MADEELLEDENELPEGCPKCKRFAPPWMTTFADMATLLMAFFALLYNFATMDVGERAKAMGSLNAAFGATVISPLIEIPISTTLMVSEDASDSESDLDLKSLSPEELAALRAEETMASLRESLAKEIKEGSVVLRKADSKVIVELQTFSSREPESTGFYLTQPVLDVSEKVLAAQAATTTEIEVRKQDLAALEQAKERRREDAKAQYEKMTQDLAEEIEAGAVELVLQDENLIVRLASQGSFVSGSANVQDGFRGLLTKIGSTLSLSEGRIRVEGHTDNVPIAFSDRFTSNWDLSSARSSSVAAVLIQEVGLNQERVIVAGLADSRPLESNDSAEGRSRNRRIEVIVRGK
ncbi:OmpA family protein [Porticoccaceae bacterium]|nr:OmpA family protein [Porticoccaceae bacterium]